MCNALSAFPLCRHPLALQPGWEWSVTSSAGPTGLNHSLPVWLVPCLDSPLAFPFSESCFRALFLVGTSPVCSYFKPSGSPDQDPSFSAWTLAEYTRDHSLRAPCVSDKCKDCVTSGCFASPGPQKRKCLASGWLPLRKGGQQNRAIYLLGSGFSLTSSQTSFTLCRRKWCRPKRTALNEEQGNIFQGQT